MENKKRISIIDIAIIFAVICIIGGVIFRTYGKNSLFGNANKYDVEYTLEITGADKEFRHLINQGDNLYLATNNMLCGKITGSAKKPSKTYVKSNDGIMIIKHNPSYIDITLTVKTQAIINENGYYLGGDYYIAPGLEDRFHTDSFEFQAKVKSIRIIESNNIG